MHCHAHNNSAIKRNAHDAATLISRTLVRTLAELRIAEEASLNSVPVSRVHTCPYTKMVATSTPRETGGSHAAVLSISTWIVLGISMILFNKALLSYWGFGFPFALTLWHCVFCSAVTQTMVMSGSTFGKEWGLLSSAREGAVTTQIFRTRILPLSLFFAGGLTLGNSAYKFLSVAYIQMLKSLSPVLLLLLAIAIGKEKPSAVQLALVAVICCGVMLASAGERHFSAVGAVLQVELTNPLARTL